MKKLYYLKTCNTCMRIIRELELPADVILHDIKEIPLTVAQLEEMHARAESYEALFSRRAKLYKEMGLKDQQLSEKDIKQYILEHYTFLKRPVMILDDHIFIGTSKKTIQNAKKALHD